MVAVENTVINAPVIYGFGTKAQEPLLFGAGADRIWPADDIKGLLKYRLTTLRSGAGDVLMVAQPTLLSLNELAKLAEAQVPFQVPGHDPEYLESYDQRRAFRAKKARFSDKKTSFETRGRRPNSPPPSRQQVEQIVAAWHAGEYQDTVWKAVKRSIIHKQIEAILNRQVEPHWPRDLVIKHTGSAARCPDAAGKRSVK